jgi:hypothetical protein
MKGRLAMVGSSVPRLPEIMKEAIRKDLLNIEAV